MITFQKGFLLLTCLSLCVLASADADAKTPTAEERAAEIAAVKAARRAAQETQESRQARLTAAQCSYAYGLSEGRGGRGHTSSLVFVTKLLDIARTQAGEQRCETAKNNLIRAREKLSEFSSLCGTVPDSVTADLENTKAIVTECVSAASAAAHSYGSVSCGKYHSVSVYLADGSRGRYNVTNRSLQNNFPTSTTSGCVNNDEVLTATLEEQLVWNADGSVKRRLSTGTAPTGGSLTCTCGTLDNGVFHTVLSATLSDGSTYRGYNEQLFPAN